LNGHAATPTFTAPILASEHFIHRGSMFTLIGGQNGDRTLGDFLQLRMGPNGEAEIGYADSNNVDEAFAPHGMFVRQNGGNGLLVASSPVNISGLAPFNAVSDPSNDGKYEVNGLSSANMPQLDITNSSVSLLTKAPCSTAAPCYQVVMKLNNLSFAPTTTQDPDLDLVWILSSCRRERQVVKLHHHLITRGGSRTGRLGKQADARVGDVELRHIGAAKTVYL